MDALDVLVHQRMMETCTADEARKLAEHYQENADLNDEYQRDAEASGDAFRRIHANRYNGDKILALLYRGVAARKSEERS